MPYKDLHEFIGKLEEEGELKRVRAEVDPLYEVGAVCNLVNDAKGSAVLFEKIKGSKIPLVAQLLASWRRIALALETEEKRIFEETLNRTERPIEPRIVSSGPCKEKVLTGKDVDLRMLPWITWNELDGGPYLDATHVIVKDPEYGRNLGIYRMMFYSKNETFVRLTPGHHGFAFYKRAEARGAPCLQMAVAVGVDPAITIASQFSPPVGHDELAVAGALRGEAVDLVKCETVDIEVPATASIVLEGEIPIPATKTGTEGPFGEFTGYISGSVPNERIWTVKAITMREDAISQGIYLAGPSDEDAYLNSLARSIQVYRDLKPRFPAIKDVYVTLGGCGHFNYIISVDGSLKYPGMVNNILASAASTLGGLQKNIIVVDDDVEIHNPEAVEWAISTRVQADRDIFIMPRCYAFKLDPSASEDGVSAKMFIDATKKEGFRGVVTRPHPEALKKAKARWAEYGL